MRSDSVNRHGPSEIGSSPQIGQYGRRGPIRDCPAEILNDRTAAITAAMLEPRSPGWGRRHRRRLWLLGPQRRLPGRPAARSLSGYFWATVYSARHPADTLPDPANPRFESHTAQAVAGTVLRKQTFAASATRNVWISNE